MRVVTEDKMDPVDFCMDTIIMSGVAITAGIPGVVAYLVIIGLMELFPLPKFCRF